MVYETLPEYDRELPYIVSGRTIAYAILGAKYALEQTDDKEHRAFHKNSQKQLIELLKQFKGVEA